MSKICPQNLLFWVIKRKVLAFDAWNCTQSWRLTRFTISCSCKTSWGHYFQNFGQFWSKNGQKWKIAIFYHFTKILITSSPHKLGSWNLVRLCKIGVQKDLSTRFLNFWVFLKIWPFSWKIWPFCPKNAEKWPNFQKYSQLQKSATQIFF